jgi:purine-nucleoside phosphorylase
MTPDLLDDSIFAASKELEGRGAPPPDVLFLLGTGVGLLPSTYQASWRLPLENVAGVPPSWRGTNILAAEAAGASFWFIEDAPREESPRPAAATPWARAFPIWLAACSGATLCVHTSAGSALPTENGDGAEQKLALLRDHINLSGSTPLLGLGESRLGPLFPDQTTLHEENLRATALAHCSRLGLPALEAVAACTSGPVLETPAERTFYSRAGAHVAVQDLAAPLVAMAHAGLSCLAIVAVLDAFQEIDIPGMVAAADRLAPTLEELLGALAKDLATTALGLREQP